MRVILVLLSVIVFSVYSEELSSSYQSCQHISLSEMSSGFPGLTCSSSQFVSNQMPEGFGDFERVFQNIAPGELRNPYHRFFVEIRDDIRRDIDQNLLRMNILKSCLSENPSQNNFEEFRSFGLSIQQARDIVQNRCENVVGNLRESISNDWGEMRGALELGWKDIGYIMPSGRISESARFSSFSISGSETSHRIPGHSQNLRNLTQDERDIVNEEMIYELTDIINEQNPGINLSSALDNSNFTVDQQLTELRNIVNSSNIPAGSIDDREVNLIRAWKRRRSRYRDLYFQKLTENPILAFIDSESPSNEELRNALDQFINSSEIVSGQLDPDSNDSLPLSSLSHYTPYIENFLSENPEYCGFAESWNRQLNRRNRRNMSIGLVGAGAMVAGCIAASVIPPVGLACWVAGASIGGGMVALSELERREVSRETTLSERSQLLDRNFSDLDEVNQNHYLNLVLAPLDLVGIGQAGRIARGLVSGGRTRVSMKAVQDSARDINRPPEERIVLNRADEEINPTTPVAREVRTQVEPPRPVWNILNIINNNRVSRNLHRLGEKLRSGTIDPKLTHVREFSDAAPSHLDHIEAGIRAQGEEVPERLEILAAFRREAAERAQNGQATYEWWVAFNQRLSILASPSSRRFGVIGTDPDPFLGALANGDRWLTHNGFLEAQRQTRPRGVHDSYLNASNFQEHFPDRIVLPTIEGELSISDLNYLAGSRISPLGLTTEAGVADGLHMEPHQFFHHDLLHANNEAYVFARYSDEMGIGEEVYETIRTRYLNHRNSVRSQDERVAFEFGYFFMTHENPGNFNRLLKENRANLTRLRGSRSVLREIQDSDYYGGSVPEWVVDEESARRFLGIVDQQIEHFVRSQ